MNKIITGACILVAICCSACSNRVQDANSFIPATITQDSQNFLKPGSDQAMISPLQQPGTAPGINPPHGQPNHRCDISVGAPLNLPASNPAALPISTTSSPAIQPVTPPAQIITSKTVTSAGMNPKHGEPGHRCDIAVGEPLNSPVTKPATNPVSAITNPIQKPTSRIVTPPGMNPQHGEPGHRCDIAVGAPLNSPATKPATQTAPTPVTTPLIVPLQRDSSS